MTWSNFTSTLHARVTALFFGVLVIVGAGYYVWMDRTVFAPPAQDAVEEYWYDELADAEIDSLAAAAAGADEATLAAMARDYGRGIADFDAEIVFFDAITGRPLAASDPDSLLTAVGKVDPQLLVDMVAPDWAFDSIYPDPSNIDAYVNRIFYVAAVPGAENDPVAYLAGSWRPLIFSEADVALDPRKLWLQAVLVALAASFAVGWVIMTWLSRRIQRLCGAVSSFASGDLSQRVEANSSDDIGRLGRNFNAMAARLESLIDELRNKELFQRQLIANISHDLRTPMASLRGYIETLSLRSDTMEASEYQRYLGIINDNLQHLDRLVDHLLQLSRLDAGQARFRFEAFPLAELADGVLARCTAPAEAKRITIDCDCPDDLPMVHADPLQIAQVLQNLIENGIKFGREGGEVVVIARAREDHTVEIAVRDDGPGIALQDQPHIFERFFTGDPSRSQKGQSSGLGLAISAKIIDGHGGELTVESQPGHGACFRFKLEVAREIDRALEAEG